MQLPRRGLPPQSKMHSPLAGRVFPLMLGFSEPERGCQGTQLTPCSPPPCPALELAGAPVLIPKAQLSG